MNHPYRHQRHLRQDRYHTRYSNHGGRDSGNLLTSLFANELVQQLAPLLLILVVPLFVLLTNKHKRAIVYPVRVLLRYVAMVLQSLAGALPWNWYAGSKEKTSEKKKIVRTRAEQSGLSNGSPAQGSSKDELDDQKQDFEPEDAEDEGYYPGIVNISGTYCFMDSTLQALASLAYLQPYINAIHIRAEELDIPTPVVDALRDILHELNTPRSSRTSLRPHALIQALSAPPPSSCAGSRSSNRLFSSREHQDAQELFQVLIEAVKTEAAEVAHEAGRDLGLGGALSPIPKQPSHSVVNGGAAPHRDSELEIMSITKSVFDGLTANRRCCVECGYTEAVMHFSFDSWQLALPRANACGLEDCLADYTRLEVLTDCICRRCSMEATYEKYAKEGVVEKPISPPASSSATLPTPDATDSVPMTPVSKSKKKRAQESRKLASRVKDLIDAGRVEEDVKGVQVVKVARASTKQAMVARPPPILVLHLNRSLHFGGVYGAAKNSCRVSFAEILDLTPYTTSGMLNTSPQAPISGPGFRPSIFMQSTGVPKVDPSTRTLYRLSGVVVHYGQHSFGHYVCYRRRPRPARLPDEKRWLPPGVRGEGESGLASLESIRGTGRGWLRVSDDDVRECGIESVLQEGAGAFMLYYERIVVPPTPPPGAPLANGQAHLPAQNEQLATPVDIASTPVDCVRRHGVYLDDDERTPRCSEETLKPANGYRKANGSIDSLASTLVDDVHEGTKAKGGAGSPAQASLEPRLVRSVSLGPYHADNRPPPERSSEVQKVEEHEESAMPNSNAAAADGDRQLNAS